MMKAGPLEAGEPSRAPGRNRGISILDFILRFVGMAGTLGSAVAMGTNDEALPFTTQFVRFDAGYDDIPEFKFFVIVNSIVCGYLGLSLAWSFLHIIRSRASRSRIILALFDTIMLALLTVASAAAAAMVYLAHSGSSAANWFPVCQQYTDFCQTSSGALIGAFGAIIVFMVILLLQGIALTRS